MFAKKTIKRAENRIFHISNDAYNACREVTLRPLAPDYHDEIEYTVYRDYWTEKQLYANYLRHKSDMAIDELRKLNTLPWYKKIFID